MALPALAILNLPEVLADSESDEIVALDLLTVREPGSQAESRLRVIRLTTRSGTQSYGDYLDFGLPARNAEQTLARLVNRYAAQNHKKNIFLTAPSMRAVGVGHTILEQTADQVLNAPPITGLGVNELFPREGFGPTWRARENQDWSSPCRQPCWTLQRKRVHAVCGSVRRFRLTGR